MLLLLVWMENVTGKSIMTILPNRTVWDFGCMKSGAIVPHIWSWCFQCVFSSLFSRLWRLLHYSLNSRIEGLLATFHTTQILTTINHDESSEQTRIEHPSNFSLTEKWIILIYKTLERHMNERFQQFIQIATNGYLKQCLAKNFNIPFDDDYTL